MHADREEESPAQAHRAPARRLALVRAGWLGAAAAAGALSCRLTDGSGSPAGPGPSAVQLAASPSPVLVPAGASTSDIQAALNSLPASGGEVYLTAGRYEIDTTISLTRSNVSLRGSGSGTLLAAKSADTDILAVTNCQGVMIRSLALQGISPGAGRGILLAQASNCVLEHLSLTACGAHLAGAIFLQGGSNDNVVSHCTFRENGGRGINLYDSCSRNILSNCHSYGNALEMVFIDHLCADNIVAHCVSVDDGREHATGIAIHDGSDRTCVTGCLVTAPALEQGIELSGCEDCLITACVVSGAPSDGLNIVNAPRSVIVANSITNNSHSALFVQSFQDATTTPVACDGLVIQGNVFSNNDSGQSLLHPTIWIAQGVDSVGSGDDISLLGNQFRDNHSRAVQVDPASGGNLRVRVEGNVFAGAHDSPVVLVAPASQAVIQSNTGFPTQTNGRATVDVGQTSVTVPHGLVATPDLVQVTPSTSPQGRSYWVSARDTSTFSIAVDAPLSTPLVFDWSARVHS